MPWDLAVSGDCLTASCSHFTLAVLVLSVCKSMSVTDNQILSISVLSFNYPLILQMVSLYHQTFSLYLFSWLLFTDDGTLKVSRVARYCIMPQSWDSLCLESEGGSKMDYSRAS